MKSKNKKTGKRAFITAGGAVSILIVASIAAYITSIFGKALLGICIAAPTAVGVMSLFYSLQTAEEYMEQERRKKKNARAERLKDYI